VYGDHYMLVGHDVLVVSGQLICQLHKLMVTDVL
jgi:hypothetical protein